MYELEKKDFEVFKKWEFDGIWREFVEVSVKASGGKLVKVLTEKSKDEFPINEITDGLDYSEFNHQPQPQITQDPVKLQQATIQRVARIKSWLAAQIKRS